MTPATRKVLVAASGASGSCYARRLLQLLLPRVDHLYFTYSRHAAEVMEHELGFSLAHSEGNLEPLLGCPHPNLRVYRPGDLTAPFASGSGVCDVTYVVPCSMGMLGRVANGSSEDLVARAADVALKERRRLVLCPRETPLSLIHLRNMVAVTEAGAIVAPAMPNFYTHPSTVEDVVDTVAWRLLSLAGIEIPPHLRWENLAG